MNAAAKALSQGSVFRTGLSGITWSKQSVFMICLMASVLLCALSVIYVENSQRRLFSELQSMQQESDQLLVERSQLILERSTWAAPARVQHLAERRMGMLAPKAGKIVVIQ
jgi:cell division protein FtsL